jgi:hypothetical protein
MMLDQVCQLWQVEHCPGQCPPGGVWQELQFDSTTWLTQEFDQFSVLWQAEHWAG